MAVQAPVKLKMHPDVDDDDDDEPLVFRRSNTSSKQIVGKSGRQGSDMRTTNGLSSSTQKNKIASSSSAALVRSPPASSNVSSSSVKTSSMKVASASPNASTISAKTSHSKSTVVISKPTECHSKQSLEQIPNAVKGENGVTKQRSEYNLKPDDSDDDKPLSSRVKLNVIHASKEQSPAAEFMDEDSDDDKPLSARLQFKLPATGSVNNKHTGNVEKKPLLSKAQQSVSIPRSSQLQSSTISNKRPFDKSIASSSYSAVKKTKLSDSTTMKQVSMKKEEDDDEDDHVPISQRINKSAGSYKKSASAKQKAIRPVQSSFKKSVNSKVKKNTQWQKESPSWSDGQKKWTTLIHNGVIFPPAYKPHGVKMLYNGHPVDLTPEQEEVATMFAVMKDTDYMEKDKFKENFWSDWRKLLGKNHVIQSLEGCDFTPIYEWAQQEKEKKKQMSKEEKAALKEAKLKEEEKYMWAIVDGVKEKVGNFRVEPPGLFRGRGEHPKMGKLKRRIHPSDITINIGKDAPIPESPIPGERLHYPLHVVRGRGGWKEIRHDNTVTWLAYWQNPINQREFKYVFLAASSALKGQSDKEKYEKARTLKDYIDDIRVNYTKDFACKDITKRQIAVATYLIDKLALRAGNEKDDDEADTVGCCTLKVENVTPLPPDILKFDFLGKDSIRYVNEVAVLPPVYKAIEKFRSGKKNGDDLFDQLDTSKLNAHLKELMPGLTAKVFRTFNASFTLQDELAKGTGEGDVTEKIAVYNSANKQVAIICNHQRTVSKTHGAQMAKLDEKIQELKAALDELKTDLARAKKGKPPLKDADGKQKRNLNPEALDRKIAQTAERIEKMERQKEAKEDLKTVALGTSKINYCDPRITVAWCKRNEVPIEKIFQKTLLAKFAWAMDTDPNFRF